jgi:hypothetical protein
LAGEGLGAGIQGDQLLEQRVISRQLNHGSFARRAGATPPRSIQRSHGLHQIV